MKEKKMKNASKCGDYMATADVIGPYFLALISKIYGCLSETLISLKGVNEAEYNNNLVTLDEKPTST